MGKAIIAVLILLLAGCTVGPDYVKPQIATQPAWRIDYQTAADLADTAWWERFGDPVLDGLIETALQENRDLKTAAARVDQFLGILDTTRSQFFPQFSAGIAASRQRDTETGPATIQNPTYDFYQGSLNVAWELDVWGRIRRATESARAQVLASEEGRRAVILTLVANVANGYIILRGLDRQLEIARETEKAYAKGLELFRQRHQYGTISRVQMSQAESQYEVARQAIPRLESLIIQQENLLSVLLGRNPGPIPRGRTIDELTTPGIPANLPSTLLDAASGYRPGRGQPGRRQCPDRRRQGALLSANIPDRLPGIGQCRPVRPVPIGFRDLVARRQCRGPHLYLRRHLGPGQAGRGAAAAGALSIPADDPDRLSRGR